MERTRRRRRRNLSSLREDRKKKKRTGQEIRREFSVYTSIFDALGIRPHKSPFANFHFPPFIHNIHMNVYIYI